MQCTFPTLKTKDTSVTLLLSHANILPPISHIWVFVDSVGSKEPRNTTPQDSDSQELPCSGTFLCSVGGLVHLSLVQGTWQAVKGHGAARLHSTWEKAPREAVFPNHKPFAPGTAPPPPQIFWGMKCHKKGLVLPFYLIFVHSPWGSISTLQLLFPLLLSSVDISMTHLPWGHQTQLPALRPSPPGWM